MAVHALPLLEEPCQLVRHEIPEFLHALAPCQHPRPKQDQPVRPFAPGLFRTGRRSNKALVRGIPENPSSASMFRAPNVGLRCGPSHVRISGTILAWTSGLCQHWRP